MFGRRGRTESDLEWNSKCKESRPMKYGAGGRCPWWSVAVVAAALWWGASDDVAARGRMRGG